MNNKHKTEYDFFIKEYGKHLPALFLKPHFFKRGNSKIMNYSKSISHNASTYYVYNPFNPISKIINHEGDVSKDT